MVLIVIIFLLSVFIFCPENCPIKMPVCIAISETNNNADALLQALIVFGRKQFTFF